MIAFTSVPRLGVHLGHQTSSLLRTFTRCCTVHAEADPHPRLHIELSPRHVELSTAPLREGPAGKKEATTSTNPADLVVASQHKKPADRLKTGEINQGNPVGEDATSPPDPVYAGLSSAVDPNPEHYGAAWEFGSTGLPSRRTEAGSSSRLMLGSRDSPRSALNSAHIISTLNPARINPADYLDLSHLRSLSIRFPESPSQKPGSINYQWQNPGTKSERIPFPSRSTGFMYYHRDRRAAPLEGSIRFRVVSDNAPSSFRDGRDLLLPSGSPWQISLVQIASLQAYSPICDQLLHENLATPAQLSQCRSLFGDRRIDPALTLFRLTQEFPFKFSMGGLCLMAVGEELHQVRFSNLFKANIGGKIHIPWTGSYLARFEGSTSPSSGHRVVRLRITKIVTAVSSSCDAKEADNRHIMRPEEGQFLTVSVWGRAPEPWTYDIDHKRTVSAVALRVLWDISS
ncbi:hypothetical protein B0H13DRAFT_1893179 [Mycena leptocephala]|nr:hypothetical protein B0H13DRAFT_1893179 [Mycena leptocephala]